MEDEDLRSKKTLLDMRLKEIKGILVEIHSHFLTLPIPFAKMAEDIDRYQIKFDQVISTMIHIYDTKGTFCSSYRNKNESILDMLQSYIKILKEIIKSIYMIDTQIKDLDDEDQDEIDLLYNQLRMIVLHEIDNMFSEVKRQSEYISDYRIKFFNSLAEARLKDIEHRKYFQEQEIEKLGIAKRYYESKRTEEAYNTSYKYHRNRARFFESGFLLVIFTGFFIYETINTVFPYNSLEIVKSLLPRLFFLSAFILLITFFLRRASHYRKIAQQAHQTSLELEALPLFMKGLREEDRYDIYKDLATKYFGQKVDQTQNDKLADIVQDQAKMSIDIAKATTEMVKSLKDVKSDQDSKKDDSK